MTIRKHHVILEARCPNMAIEAIFEDYSLHTYTLFFSCYFIVNSCFV